MSGVEARVVDPTLHALAERGDVAAIRAAIHAHAFVNVEARTEYGRTPIMLAAARDRVDVVA